MTRATQIAILDANNARCKEIMISKSNDYANEDVLSNFKLVAKLEGSTPVKDIFGHIANKVVRLGNLLGNDKSPLNESVSDSASDLINYLHLLTMAIQEGEVLKSDPYTSSQNENFDNFLKGPIDPYHIHLPILSGVNPYHIIETATKTEAPIQAKLNSHIKNFKLKLDADNERLNNPPKTVFEFPKSKIDKNDPFAIPADYDKFTEDEKADFLFDYLHIKQGKHVNVDVENHMTLNKKTKNAITDNMNGKIIPFCDVDKNYRDELDPKNYPKGPVTTKTEAPTVNHISQVEKTKLAHEKKSGILSGFDQNGCGRV